MRSTWIIVILLPVYGCAMQQEVLRVGDDTYQTSAVAAPVRGGSAGARDLALGAANAKCEAMGQRITVTDTKLGWSFPANGTATITFVCK